MNPNKDENLKKSLAAFKGMEFKRLNNDTHWKFGRFNFFPTTHKWTDDLTKEYGHGIDSALIQLRSNPDRPKLARYKTVEELFDIARKVKPMNLEAVCIAIHKEIYK